MQAQQGRAFTRITTDDGIGLASNLVTSLYQDPKGFIWVGTANGLQRFDGSKFIHFSTKKPGSEQLPHTTISQIIPADSGYLVLAMYSQREFGLFDPATFRYRKALLKTSFKIDPRAEFRLWKDSKGEIYLNILKQGILKYDKKENAFVDNKPFPFPENWIPTLLGVHEDLVKKQYWFTCDSGLCIYDTRSKQMWYKNNNPQGLPVLQNIKLHDHLTQVYIDRQRRIWLFGWPASSKGEQYKSCLDSTGSKFLVKDTIGLNQENTRYVEYNYFLETQQGDLWIYGLGELFNYDRNTKRFYYNKSGDDNISIEYNAVYQVLEDKEDNIWIATDRGIYFTANGATNFSIANITFKSKIETTTITDILEMRNGDIWVTSWGTGVKSLDKFFRKTENDVYRQSPPANWSEVLKNATKLTWSMCRQTSTGNVWIGCNGGVLMIHDPIKKTTTYLNPPELNNSTIRYIAEDHQGQMWLATQGGRLIKWNNNQFTIVQDIGTIIYKVFVDKQGWLWLATHEKGLYAINSLDGRILQHYSANNGNNSLYSNTGYDIEQLNTSTIVFGAGALHFINKNSGKVSIVKFENGLPSNTVQRLRMDKYGFLWIITSNGLCRYNPTNNRITPYGRKDGVIFAEQTTAADYFTSTNEIMFAGSNAMIVFNPSIFSNTKPPPDVSITDFKIFNEYFPVDSLFKQPEIKLNYDKNSLSIYFASLSYTQRDKLTYYYKMEGIDKAWMAADRSYYVNYSSLPPGNYTFKIYCETIEGLRSLKTTQIQINIKPPFWRTLWFMSCLLFVVALLIYAVHDLRVKRLLAVEALRNRVARDLHDDMGSTLSTINILSSMAKSKINVDMVKTNEYLSKISENSQRMMEAMDDIVWSIKPSNDSMQKITARMREFITNVLEAKDIDFEFVVNEVVNDVKLNMAARRDFFLIFKEAVNNAAKYSKAMKVFVSISMQHKKLTLIINDDGVGFEVAEADGNGLGNMHKRADNLNGVVTIRSKKGEGTTVRLVIPVT
jgi:signal transduction histidine kinase/ligand-binding sensor domain-containing protein